MEIQNCNRITFTTFVWWNFVFNPCHSNMSMSMSSKTVKFVRNKKWKVPRTKKNRSRVLFHGNHLGLPLHVRPRIKILAAKCKFFFSTLILACYQNEQMISIRLSAHIRTFPWLECFLHRRILDVHLVQFIPRDLSSLSQK